VVSLALIFLRKYDSERFSAQDLFQHDKDIRHSSEQTVQFITDRIESEERSPTKNTFSQSEAD
jgi:hypothetical protein